MYYHSLRHFKEIYNRMQASILLLILAYCCCSSVVSSEEQVCTTPGSCEDTDTIIPPEKLPNGMQQPLNDIERYELHEMHESLKEIAAEINENVGITTVMQRHVERLLIQDQYPNNNEENETPQEDKYATFGSLLDISTAFSVSWGGSTEFGGKVSWIGSMFWRKDIIENEKKKEKSQHDICRTDLTNDYDKENKKSCIHGITIDNYVSVRPTPDKKHEHMELAASWEILGDKGTWRTGKIMDLKFGNQKFDTIVANGMIAGSDYELQDMDLLLEKVVSLLKPGGVLFVIGTEPSKRVEGPNNIYNEIMDVINSVKKLWGESPIHNMPATWIIRTLDRLGVNVFSSTLFPAKAAYEDMAQTVGDAIEWIEEEADDGGDEMWAGIKGQYMEMLEELLETAEAVAGRGPVYGGEDQYIIAAKLPLDGEKKDDNSPLIAPTVYEPKAKAKKKTES